jgi:hypothetical protein
MTPTMHWTSEIEVGNGTAPRQTKKKFSDLLFDAASEAGLTPRFQTVEHHEPHAPETPEVSARRSALVARLFELAREVDEFVTQRRALDRAELQRKLADVIAEGLANQEKMTAMPPKVHAALTQINKTENAWTAAVNELNRLKSISPKWESAETKAARQAEIKSAQELAGRLREQTVLARSDYARLVQEQEELKQRDATLTAERDRIKHELGPPAEAETE